MWNTQNYGYIEAIVNSGFLVTLLILVILLFFYELSCVACDRQGTRMIPYEGESLVGGDLIDGTVSEASCVQRCLNDETCLSVDYNHDYENCWWHQDLRDGETDAAQCCTHYRKEEVCLCKNKHYCVTGNVYLLNLSLCRETFFDIFWKFRSVLFVLSRESRWNVSSLLLVVKSS